MHVQKIFSCVGEIRCHAENLSLAKLQVTVPMTRLHKRERHCMARKLFFVILSGTIQHREIQIRRPNYTKRTNTVISYPGNKNATLLYCYKLLNMTLLTKGSGMVICSNNRWLKWQNDKIPFFLSCRAIYKLQ